jgi:hypothetical protein
MYHPAGETVAKFGSEEMAAYRGGGAKALIENESWARQLAIRKSAVAVSEKLS